MNPLRPWTTERQPMQSEHSLQREHSLDQVISAMANMNVRQLETIEKKVCVIKMRRRAELILAHADSLDNEINRPAPVGCRNGQSLVSFADSV